MGKENDQVTVSPIFGDRSMMSAWCKAVPRTGAPIRSWPSTTGRSVMRAYRTASRGVRIQITLTDGTVVYDGDDSHDMGNALHGALDYANEHADEL